MSENLYEGTTPVEDLKIGIAVSQWYPSITDKMMEDAINKLVEEGVSKENIIVARCPGSFELPLAAQFMLESKELDGVIALGLVIRGETTHYDYVCDAVTSGISTLNLDYNIPIAFGVLTTENTKQAEERVNGTKGNKGEDAALAVLQMISLKYELNTK